MEASSTGRHVQSGGGGVEPRGAVMAAAVVVAVMRDNAAMSWARWDGILLLCMPVSCRWLE